MGQALQRAAQWTSAKDGSGGKLEFTKINEELLNTIIKFIEGFSSKYPEESKLVFKKALTWTSSLSAQSMSGPGIVDRYEWVYILAGNSVRETLRNFIGHLVLNLKQNSMARRHALFLGRHALSDSAMPICLAPCHQNVPLIKMLQWFLTLHAFYKHRFTWWLHTFTPR